MAAAPVAVDREVDFTRFYRRHRPALIAFASRRVSQADVDDLVAEAFIRAYQSLPVTVWGIEGDSRAWLFRVLQNLLISAARRRSTADREHRTIGASDVHDDERNLEAVESDIEAAFRGLPMRQSTVLELRFLLDFDVATTASIMELSHDGVRSLTHRALRALRSSLEGHQ